MGSLTSCLKKAGNNLSADDKAEIRKDRDSYTDDGLSTQQADIAAAKDMLEGAIADRAELAAVITARGGVVPDLKEATPVVAQEPAVGEPQADTGTAFTPTHELSDGTLVVAGQEANVWVDAEGIEIEDDSAVTIAEAKEISGEPETKNKPEPTNAGDIAAVSADDFAAMMDDVGAEAKESVTEAATPAPEAKPPAPTKPAAGPKPGTKPQKRRLTKPAERKAKVASDAIKAAAKHGVKGADEALTGLTELFGGKKLSSGFTFDEDTYAAAKPHFKKSLEEFVAAGKSLKEYIQFIIGNFGEGVKPYLARFHKDLQSSTIKVRGVNDGDELQNQVGAVPEGDQGQAGLSGRPSGNRPDTGNLEGDQSQDAQAAEESGAPADSGAGTSSAGVGGGGDASESGNVGDGRQGAGSEGVVDAGAGNRPSGGRSGADVLENFHVDDPLEIVGGGQVARFNKNKKAIELYTDLSTTERKPTREDQKTLAGYTGWGSFGQELFQGTWASPAPKKGWEARSEWLREHMGKEAWQSANRSITNAHYTDPPTVMAMWAMMERMGFKGGRVLEPSMGIGNFFGMMPKALKDRSDLTGIELDEMTGGIAKMLYPQANISIKGYQESKTPDDFYDLVIGNWPFENLEIADRRYQKLRPLIHDYFFLKALDQVRPGGFVVGITSKGSMDKVNSNIRMALAKKAEFVGAFRLPSGAFQSYAGTKVVTDIVILKKREAPVGMITDEWTGVKPYKTPHGEEVNLNKYYHSHIHNVLGTIDFGHGTTQGRAGMIVNRPKNLEEQIQVAIKSLPEGAYVPRDEVEHVQYITNHTDDRQGALIQQDGGFFVIQGEHLAPANEVKTYQVKTIKARKAREDQFIKLIGTRKAYADLIQAEQGKKPLLAITAKRRALKTAYQSFVAAHGPMTPSFGLGYMRRIGDPFYPSLAALEINNGTKEKPEWQPSAIMERSTTRGGTGIKNPSIPQAYVLSRNDAVMPTLADIAKIADKPVEEVKKELLGTHAVFLTPTGDVIPSDIYLSGNVRQKLRDAHAAVADGYEDLAANVEALESVIPKDIPYHEIEARFGASWISTDIYGDYVANMINLTDEQRAQVEVTYTGGRWKVVFPKTFSYKPEAKTGYGTGFYPFHSLVNKAISNQSVVIKYEDADGVSHVDTEATEETNDRIAKIRGDFGEWVWSSPDRRIQLEQEYNENRNAWATPKFDGSFLDFVGMALKLGKKKFDLRQHQVNAIWAGIVNRKSLNAHEVGTGKTFTIAGITMESRRYGIAKKPLILAHNANSATVAAEFLQMYPAAKVLYIDNMSPASIDLKLRQIQTDDWDAVIMPHSLIDRLTLTEKTMMAMAAEEIAALENEALEAAADAGVALDLAMMDDEEEMKKVRSPTAKDLVKARNKIIEKIRRDGQRSSREGAVPFEELGLDMILVDEVHEFKKPTIVTKMSMKGLNTQTSNKSIALQFLTRYTRAQNSGANVHLFTGTPITNTLTEIYHQMRYVMEEEMAEADVSYWDGWFGSFASEESDVELNAAQEYEAVTRLSSFINVPELRTMVGQYMDVVFSDTMPEMQPRKTKSGKTMASKDLTESERAELENGRTEEAEDRPYKRVIIDNADMTPAQLREFQVLRQYARDWRSMDGKARMEAMRSGDPRSPIITEGLAGKASFDVRLLEGERLAGQEGQAEDHPNSKASRVVKNGLEVYKSDPRTTQVIFMSAGLSTRVTRTRGTGADKVRYTQPAFSTARDIIARLVDGGVPRNEIYLVTGATSKDKRKWVAQEMNAGTIRFVLGNTSTLGIGVNMQKNLRAIHHLDAPWMPGELEQRNGRGHRQGNQWNTVREYRYITDRLDGRRWQILAIKQRFIRAFLEANDSTRSIEGDAASDEQSDILETFSEAAGDPRILIREKLKKKIERLESKERMHTFAVSDAHQQINSLSERIVGDKEWNKAEKVIDNVIRPALEAGKGDGFTAKVRRTEYTARKKTDAAISKFIKDKVRIGNDPILMGEFMGMDLWAGWDSLDPEPHIFVDFSKLPGVNTRERWRNWVKGKPTVASLSSQLRERLGNVEYGKNLLSQHEKSKVRMQEISKEPFKQAPDLARQKRSLEALGRDLKINPVPPPAWLRAGAPIDTEVFWVGADEPATTDSSLIHNKMPVFPKTRMIGSIVDDLGEVVVAGAGTNESKGAKKFSVDGHQWSQQGWFVLAHDEAGAVSIPYNEAQDSQGFNIYEEKTFTAPDAVIVQDDKEQSVQEPESAYSTGQNAPFYSELTRQIEAIKQPKAGKIQWLGMIRKLTQKGVKPDEIAWSGIEGWIAEQKGPITKAELLAEVRRNEVVVEEVVYGGGTVYETTAEEEARGRFEEEFTLDNDVWGEWMYESVLGEISGAWEDSRHKVWNNLTYTKEDYLNQETDEDGDADKQAARESFEEDATDLTLEEIFDGAILDEIKDEAFSGTTYIEDVEEERVTADRERLYAGEPTHGKFSEWQMEGDKKGYRELLVTLPTPDWYYEGRQDAPSAAAAAKIYRGPHYDEPNIAVHIRFNEREIDGKRTLFVEEVQSDWAQAGRKEGYAGATKYTEADFSLYDVKKFGGQTRYYFTGPEGISGAYGSSEQEALDYLVTDFNKNPRGVPNQPFKESHVWAMIGVKRAIRWAAENGFEQVAWTPGEVQVERYREALRKQVDRIEWAKEKGGVRLVGSKNGTQTVDTTEKETALSDAIGKAMGDQILKDPAQSGVIEGDDITISDTGMAGFYDKIMPTAVKKFVKKFGAKVGVSRTGLTYEEWLKTKGLKEKDGRLVTDTGFEPPLVPSKKEYQLNQQEVWTFPVTEKMRESVMKYGVPLFEPKSQYVPTQVEVDTDYQAAAQRSVDSLGEGTALLANALSQDFVDKSNTFLVGQEITGPQDLAALGQVYRNPSFETFRVFFMKAGKIVGQTGVSSRLPGTTAIWSNRVTHSTMVKAMEGLKADGYYMLHNHPSGDPKPSGKDIEATQKLARDIPGMIGHVIIDHTEYSNIKADGKASINSLPLDVLKDASRYDASRPTIPHPLLGYQIDNEAKLAMVGMELAGSKNHFQLVGSSNQGVTGIMDVPITALEKGNLRLIAAVKKFQRQTGSADVFAMNVPESARERLVKAIQTNVLRDAALKTGESVKESNPGAYARKGMMAGRKHGKAYTIAEPKQGKQTDTAAFKRWFGDSKVVDEKGEPLVVYHGTRAHRGELTEFDIDEAKDGYFYFSESDKYAKHYGDVDGYFLKIDKPFDFDKPGNSLDMGAVDTIENWIKYLNEIYPGYGFAFEEDEYSSNDEVPLYELTKHGTNFDSVLYAHGHDGFTGVEGGNAFFATDIPTNVKSVGNRGTFDPNDPSILNEPEREYRVSERAAIHSGIQDRLDAFRFQVQDKLIDLKRKQQKIGEDPDASPITDAENAYQKAAIWEGRAGEQINDFDEKQVQPLLESVARTEMTIDEVGEWLVARHAEEANAYLAEINPDMDAEQRYRLSGMDNDTAQQILTDNAGNDALQQVGEQIDAMNRSRVQMLIDRGRISQEMADAWQGRYEHYVPLKRAEAEIEGGILPPRGKGFHLRGKASKQRTGSAYWTPSKIIANTLAQYETSIIDTEKNRVGQALLELAEQHPDEDFWLVDVERKRKDVRKLKSGNKVVEVPDTMDRPNDLSTWRDGVRHTIVFNQNNKRAMRLASGLKNLNAAQMNTVFQGLAKVNRFLSMINTGWNPEFIISNFARDIQTAAYNMSDTELKDLEMKVLKSVPSAINGIRSSLFGDGSAEWSDTWEDFREHGGKTGWIDLHANLEVKAHHLQKQVDRMRAGKAPKHLFMRFLQSVDDLNTVVENGVRLASYKHALDAGLTKDQAAALAKDLTVNFNRKGNMGPSMNALYLFANASAQGSVRLLQAMVHSKKGRKLALATVGFAITLDMLNRAMSGDDDDGENLYDALPDYIKDRNLIIMGEKEPLVKIPLPWGYSVLHTVGQSIGASMTSDRFDPLDAAARVALATMDSFNPVGSATFLQTLSPTLIDPFIQGAENKSFAGNPVKPEQMPFGPKKPEYLMHWKSARVESQAITKWLNDATGGNEIRPGSINVSPEWIDLGWDFATGGLGRTAGNSVDVVQRMIEGKEIPTERIPFVRKVTGYNNKYGVKSRYYEWSKDVAYAKKEARNLKGLRRVVALRQPTAKLIPLYSATEKKLRKLRKVRREAVSNDAPDIRIEAIDSRIRAIMVRFNKVYSAQVLSEKSRKVRNAN